MHLNFPAALCALAFMTPFMASAQSVAGTVPAGTAPQALAVNPVTNKTYVANSGSNNVTVIDGLTDTAITIPAGTTPYAVAVNPVTNKIYVANKGSGNVTVIDGASNGTTTVSVGSNPESLAVNPVTNKIYVANNGSANVTVVDGLTNTTTPVAVGSGPDAVALNPVTNKIYVANANGNTVTVIDGGTNSATPVSVGSGPSSVAVNPVTNKIYVVNTGSNSVTVINGATNSTGSVSVGPNPTSVVANPVTNQIYVVNSGNLVSMNGSVTVIDGSSNNTTSLAPGTNPDALAVNPTTNEIFLGFQTPSGMNATVTVLDGGTRNVTATLTVGAGVSAIAVSPVTDKAYVANGGSNTVSVIDGSTNTQTALSYGFQPSSFLVNPVTNRLYFLEITQNIPAALIVVDGSTLKQIKYLPLPGNPGSLLNLNRVTNKIYVGGTDLLVIDGDTNTITNTLPGYGVLAVNEVTNKLYVTVSGGLGVLDGLTNTLTMLATEITANSTILGAAIDEGRDKVYVTNYGSGDSPSTVIVIDGATNGVSTIPVGSGPTSVVVNPVTNKIYVTNTSSNNVTVIDGATHATTTVAAGTAPEGLAVNPLTNKIYVANGSSDYVTVIDGATLSETTVPLIGPAYGVVVNPLTNHIYLNNYAAGAVTILDGATNMTTMTETLVGSPSQVVLNAVTNQIYVPTLSIYTSNDLTLLTEQPVQAIPLTVTIAPLPGNQTNSPNPTFTFTASSTTVAQPNAVFYQVDTWQNKWALASGSNPTFSGMLANLQPGFHVLYAYAADGEEATATQPGSPLTGSIQAYGFLFAPPRSAQTITFPNVPVQMVGKSLTLGASASSGLPIMYEASTPDVCAITGSTAVFFSAGTCTITASQPGSPNYLPATPVSQSFSVTGGSTGSVTSSISGQSPGPLRNNYTGFVGFQFTVGTNPLMVFSLGRFIAPGNSETHQLKLVQANGTDVTGGSATVVTAGAPVGQYQYAPLASPITLAANTTYYLMSQELTYGDQWYDYGPVSASSALTVLGATYVDGNGKYYTVAGSAGEAYVPLNFVYGTTGANTLSATITSPTAGATLTGTTAISVATTGPVTSLQLQVDGVNQGSAVPVTQSPTSLSLNTTGLSNGAHTLKVIASDAQSNMVSSSGVPVTISNLAGTATAFVTGQTPGALRNNYSGFVGMAINVGSAPLIVSSLGRYVVAGNSGTHVVKLVQANGVDVPNGSVALSLSGATSGTYRYASLPSGSVTLSANSSYFLVSQEMFGGDQWYDYSPVSTTSVAKVVGSVYTDGGGHYVTVGGSGGESYVPVSFLYGGSSSSLSAIITSPQSGSTLSGSVVVAVTTTGNVSSLQLQVDGVNHGAAVGSSPLTLDTTTVANGSHVLTVVVTDSSSATAVSPGVSVTVNNGGGASTAFLTAETPSYLRNNYSGFVGMAIQVGSTSLTVTQLGRLNAAGNSGTHVVKLVDGSGNDVPGGAVTVSLSGSLPAGQFAYGTLASPVTLLANTSYYLVSQEVAGGDQWYDLEPVSGTGVAQVNGPTYTDGSGHYVVVGGMPGYCYVPVSFLYR